MGPKSSDDDKPIAKPKHRKGLWSPDEDQKLRNYVIQNGHACWSSIAINAGLQRNGKSCRLRWINYLRPGLKRGMFNFQEEDTILTLHRQLGNKWSRIAQYLPGRTDNEIKNYWHSHLKKKLAKLKEMEAAAAAPSSQNMESSSPSSNIHSTHSSSLESLNRRENSSADTDTQCVPPQGHKSFLPKLLFAEWLSLDHANNNDGNNGFANNNSSEQMGSKDNGLNFVQDSISSNMHGCYLSNEVAFGGDHEFIENGFDNSLIDEMLSSRIFNYEDHHHHHHQFSRIGFVDSITEVDLCSNLNMNNDLMYI